MWTGDELGVDVTSFDAGGSEYFSTVKVPINWTTRKFSIIFFQACKITARIAPGDNRKLHTDEIQTLYSSLNKY